jgi:hypothetical protein
VNRAPSGELVSLIGPGQWVDQLPDDLLAKRSSDSDSIGFSKRLGNGSEHGRGAENCL